MTLERVQGTTILTGPVRDQAELQGLLQRVAGLGLALLSANAFDDQGHGARGAQRGVESARPDLT
jgi:hypothetical protein